MTEVKTEQVAEGVHRVADGLAAGMSSKRTGDSRSSTPAGLGAGVTFHLPSRGVVIAGDEIVVRDPITGACGPRIPHDAVNAQRPAPGSRSSSSRASRLTRLLTGHGDPWRGSMGDAVAQAREADAD